MRTIVIAAVLALGAGGAASAQGYPGYIPPKPPGSPQDIRTPEPPKFPKPPRAPEYVTPPKFKPFTGQHYDTRPTSPNGFDPYPKPKKPKGGFSTYDGH